ncbi:SPFH/Band 7/PHB domain protein [Nocardia sp. CA2R105]|uniref:SPFH domain-containing protein n=1 Tax=Nocardia coffeae TaxID=2873381 RepID=UPI001CA78B0D|nr:SPFH domain-containing protein [Nocardia coffeae]MBY8860185.1 SPFH/Band 7/PHB domain protein [Nocardia coffeae]
MVALIVAVVLVLLVAVVVFKSIALVPQAEAAVIERLGRYSRTVSGQLTFLVPFADRVRAKVDLRERVVSFPPQPVITQDNLTVQIDSVVYFQVTSPQAAVYEISNYIAAVEQLTITTLRNVVGGMTLEETLTSRDQINSQLRGVLDEATGRWGLRVARVELKAIDPPPSIQESMEKQMKADREKRAMILTAEGNREAQIRTAEGAKQAQILSAEGSKQSAILGAEGERQSRILRAQGERAAAYLQAQGEAKAIEKVFAAIKSGKPTPELLAYQYMQTLPEVAKGDANKVWMVPSDFGKALEGFARNFGTQGEDGVFRYESSADGAETSGGEDDSDEVADWFDVKTDPAAERAVRAAEAAAAAPVEAPSIGQRGAPSQSAIGQQPNPAQFQPQPPSAQYQPPPAQYQQPQQPRSGQGESQGWRPPEPPAR